MGKVDLTQTAKAYQHKATMDDSKTSGAAKKVNAFGSAKMASWTMVALKNTNLTNHDDDEDEGGLARKDSLGSNKWGAPPGLSQSQLSKVQRTQQLVAGAA